MDRPPLIDGTLSQASAALAARMVAVQRTKMAMDKCALSGLGTLGNLVGHTVSHYGKEIMANPDVAKALAAGKEYVHNPIVSKALIGSGIGGAVGLGSSFARRKEKGEPRHHLSSALAGALAGGAVGGGIGTAQKYWPEVLSGPNAGASAGAGAGASAGAGGGKGIGGPGASSLPVGSYYDLATRKVVSPTGNSVADIDKQIVGVKAQQAYEAQQRALNQPPTYTPNLIQRNITDPVYDAVSGYLKKHYWPRVAGVGAAVDIGRQLTPEGSNSWVHANVDPRYSKNWKDLERGATKITTDKNLAMRYGPQQAWADLANDMKNLKARGGAKFPKEYQSPRPNVGPLTTAQQQAAKLLGNLESATKGAKGEAGGPPPIKQTFFGRQYNPSMRSRGAGILGRIALLAGLERGEHYLRPVIEQKGDAWLERNKPLLQKAWSQLPF